MIKKLSEVFEKRNQQVGHESDARVKFSNLFWRVEFDENHAVITPYVCHFFKFYNLKDEKQAPLDFTDEMIESWPERVDDYSIYDEQMLDEMMKKNLSLLLKDKRILDSAEFLFHYGTGKWAVGGDKLKLSKLFYSNPTVEEIQELTRLCEEKTNEIYNR
ncbi:MAG: hypothetical protein E7374_00900 [Clostridiales bacterium]|nr:hypothetical protein [Clostridiales bacterium]